MCIKVTFESIRAATLEAAEDALLVWADRDLVALLVPAEEGWFIQFGLGPCEREDLIFSTLSAAEAWVRGCLSDRARRTKLKAEPLESCREPSVQVR